MRNKIIHMFLPFNFYYAALSSVLRYLAGMSFTAFPKITFYLNMHVSISVVIHTCKWLAKRKGKKATTTMATTTKKETEESGASCWWIMELKLFCLL